MHTWLMLHCHTIQSTSSWPSGMKPGHVILLDGFQTYQLQRNHIFKQGARYYIKLWCVSKYHSNIISNIPINPRSRPRLVWPGFEVFGDFQAYKDQNVIVGRPTSSSNNILSQVSLQGGHSSCSTQAIL